MPVPSTAFRPDQDTIAEDRLCPGCEYNLRGLRVGDRCPECGVPISGVRPRGTDDKILSVPMSYLQGLSASATGLMLSGPLLLVCITLLVFLWHHAEAVIIAAFLLLAGAVWAISSYLLCKPRILAKVPEDAARQTSFILRTGARGTQALWPAGAAMLLQGLHAFHQSAKAFLPTSVGTQIFVLLGCLLLCIAIVGSGLLCVWMASLADWAKDHDLAGKLRGAGLGVSLAGPLSVGCFLLSPLLGGGTLSFITVTMSVVFTLWFLYACFSLMLALYRFSSVAKWTSLSAKARLERDRRLSAKIVGRIENAKAKDEPPRPLPEHARLARHRPQGNYLARPEDAPTYDIGPGSDNPQRP